MVHSDQKKSAWCATQKAFKQGQRTDAAGSEIDSPTQAVDMMRALYRWGDFLPL
jgi:hypothetical protein